MIVNFSTRCTELILQKPLTIKKNKYINIIYIKEKYVNNNKSNETFYISILIIVLIEFRFYCNFVVTIQNVSLPIFSKLSYK